MSSFRTRPTVGLPAATKISEGPSGVSVKMGMQLVISANADYTPTVDSFHGRLIRLGSRYPGPWDVNSPIPAGAIATNVNAAAARGWEIIFNLNGALDRPLGGDDPTNYKAYVSAVVTALIGKVTLFDLRNEPTGATMTGPTHVINTADMNAEAALALEAVRAANPLARLMGPGDLSLGGSGGRTVTIPAYRAGAMWTTLDACEMHNYYLGIPEMRFAQEIYLVERAVHTIRPTMPIVVSEFGWKLNTTPDDDHNYVATGAEQGRRMSRALAIYRCVPYIAAVSLYTHKDDGSGEFGLLDTNNIEKTCGQYYRDTLLHLNTWYAACAYSPGLTPGRPEYDASVFFNGVDTAPWIVRGTLLDESQELMVWHPSVASYPLRIVLKASSAGNLKILTVGGSTATSTLVAGVQSVDVVLGATPQIIYSDDSDLIFPGYNH